MTRDRTIFEILPTFLDYITVERQFARTTVQKYGDNVRAFLGLVGDAPVASIGIEHFITLKARMSGNGIGPARIGSVICAMKCLLTYAKEVLHFETCDLATIRVPRPPRREVGYLTLEEFEVFVENIPLRTWTGAPRVSGVKFRAVAETLFATGMRISEALSLDRGSIDRERRQAAVTGKGNKERLVFFTERALAWISRYVELRTDTCPALFLSNSGRRLTPQAVQVMFARHARGLGLKKHVTPHIIRHSTATHLLRKGCPLGFIKEILGHERLETTCRFYLGLMDAAEAQRAHERFMTSDASTRNDQLTRALAPLS